MKTSKIFNLFALAVAFTAVSCTGDFLDRNTNPEQAYEEHMKHDGLAIGGPFSQMTKNVSAAYQMGASEYGSDRYQVIQDLAGNIFSGYTGATNSGFTQNNLYNITAGGWSKGMFEDVYERLVTQAVNVEPLRESFPSEVALVDIVKVAGLHRVTDSYGPIPYSVIYDEEQVLARPYDSQEQVYRGMFKDLDNAIETLQNQALGGGMLLADYDDVFYGDVAKWVKFANTLRLRLAMHVVYADEALAFEEAEKSINNPVGLMTEAGDAAYLHPGAGAWQYPLYTIQYDFNNGDSAVGATIETYMNSFGGPRREKLFTKVSDGARDYIGVRNGVTNGSDYKLKVSRILCDQTSPMLWMAPAEAYFLKAEYWLRKGDEAQAKTAYEEGVKVAFATVGAAGADEYLASTATVGGYTDPVGNNSYENALSGTPVVWSGASSFENHLEQIITQKYIAMFPEGQEAWTEYRRTGYPNIIPVKQNNSGGTINTNLQVRRLPYPSSEYQANATNVAAAVTLLAGEAKSGSADNGGTRLWWDKNPRF